MSAASITSFVRLLKQSPRGAVFNPWWEVDPDSDIGPQAPRIRREQLAAYLTERMGKARLVLIGEAVGYRGGHFSGIAMTSERLLLEQPQQVLGSHLPQRTSRSQLNPRGFAEPTASIVWRVLLEAGLAPDAFVLWNAFPWHSFDPRAGRLSNRAPTKNELAAGLPVLAAFTELFAPCERVVALGRLAAAQLTALLIPADHVRHPASGGAALFRRQIAAIIRAA
jgi:hypothetical protein